jgi:competence transcription factor ComK
MSFRRQKTWEEEKTRQFDQRQKGPSYHRLPYRVLARAENGDWSIALPVFTYACDYFPTFSLRIEKGCVNQISSAVPKLLVSYRLTNLANTPPALVLPQTSAWLLLLAPILQPTNTLWTFQTHFEPFKHPLKLSQASRYHTETSCASFGATYSRQSTRQQRCLACG